MRRHQRQAADFSGTQSNATPPQILRFAQNDNHDCVLATTMKYALYEIQAVSCYNYANTFHPVIKLREVTVR